VCSAPGHPVKEVCGKLIISIDNEPTVAKCKCGELVYLDESTACYSCGTSCPAVLAHDTITTGGINTNGNRNEIAGVLC